MTLAENSRVFFGDRESADQVVLAQQRNAQQRPRSCPQQHVAERAAVRARLG